MKHDPHCEKSPTGAHRWQMEWRGPEYWHVCQDCGAEWQADETLGATRLSKLSDGTTFYRGRKSEFRLKRSKGVSE